MFEACWLELKLKDGRTGRLQTKLIILFKGSGVSVLLKPYEAEEGINHAICPQYTSSPFLKHTALGGPPSQYSSGSFR